MRNLKESIDYSIQGITDNISTEDYWIQNMYDILDRMDSLVDNYNLKGPSLMIGNQGRRVIEMILQFNKESSVPFPIEIKKDKNSNDNVTVECCLSYIIVTHYLESDITTLNVGFVPVDFNEQRQIYFTIDIEQRTLNSNVDPKIFVGLYDYVLDLAKCVKLGFINESIDYSISDIKQDIDFEESLRNVVANITEPIAFLYDEVLPVKNTYIYEPTKYIDTQIWLKVLEMDKDEMPIFINKKSEFYLRNINLRFDPKKYTVTGIDLIFKDVNDRFRQYDFTWEIKDGVSKVHTLYPLGNKDFAEYIKYLIEIGFPNANVNINDMLSESINYSISDLNDNETELKRSRLITKLTNIAERYEEVLPVIDTTLYTQKMYGGCWEISLLFSNDFEDDDVMKFIVERSTKVVLRKINIYVSEETEELFEVFFMFTSEENWQYNCGVINTMHNSTTFKMVDPEMAEFIKYLVKIAWPDSDLQISSLMKESIDYSISGLEDEDSSVKFNEELIDNAKYELENIFGDLIKEVNPCYLDNLYRYSIVLNTVPSLPEGDNPFYFREKNQFGYEFIDIIYKVIYFQYAYTFEELYNFDISHDGYSQYFNYSIKEDKIIISKFNKKYTDINEFIDKEHITHKFAEFLYDFIHKVNPDSQITFNSEITESINYSISGLDNEESSVKFNEELIDNAKYELENIFGNWIKEAEPCCYFESLYEYSVVLNTVPSLPEGDNPFYFREKNQFGYEFIDIIYKVIYFQSAYTFEELYNFDMTHDGYPQYFGYSIKEDKIIISKFNKKYTDINKFIEKEHFTHKFAEFLYEFIRTVNPDSKITFNSQITESINYSISGLNDSTDSYVDFMTHKYLDNILDFLPDYKSYDIHDKEDYRDITILFNDYDVEIPNIDSERSFILILSAKIWYEPEDKDYNVISFTITKGTRYGYFEYRPECDRIVEISSFVKALLNDKETAEYFAYLISLVNLNTEINIDYLISKINESIDYSIGKDGYNEEDSNIDIFEKGIAIMTRNLDKIADIVDGTIETPIFTYNKSTLEGHIICDIDSITEFIYRDKKFKGKVLEKRLRLQKISLYSYYPFDKGADINFEFDTKPGTTNVLKYGYFKDKIRHISTNLEGTLEDRAFAEFLADMIKCANPQTQITAESLMSDAVTENLTESINYSIADPSYNELDSSSEDYIDKDNVFDKGKFDMNKNIKKITDIFDVDIEGPNFVLNGSALITYINFSPDESPEFKYTDVTKTKVTDKTLQVKRMSLTSYYPFDKGIDVNFEFTTTPGKDITFKYSCREDEILKSRTNLIGTLEDKTLAEFLADMIQFTNPRTEITADALMIKSENDEITESINYSISGLNDSEFVYKSGDWRYLPKGERSAEVLRKVTEDINDNIIPEIRNIFPEFKENQKSILDNHISEDSYFWSTNLYIADDDTYFCNIGSSRIKYILQDIKIWCEIAYGQIRTILLFNFIQNTDRATSKDKYFQLYISEGKQKIFGDLNKIDNLILAEKLAEVCNLFFNSDEYTPDIFMTKKVLDLLKESNDRISESVNYSVTGLEDSEFVYKSGNWRQLTSCENQDTVEKIASDLNDNLIPAIKDVFPEFEEEHNDLEKWQSCNYYKWSLNNKDYNDESYVCRIGTNKKDYLLRRIVLEFNEGFKNSNNIETSLIVIFQPIDLCQYDSTPEQRFVMFSISDGVPKISGKFNKSDNEFVAEKLAELCNIFFNTDIYTPNIFLTTKAKAYSKGFQISESVNYSVTGLEKGKEYRTGDWRYLSIYESPEILKEIVSDLNDNLIPEIKYLFPEFEEDYNGLNFAYENVYFWSLSNNDWDNESYICKIGANRYDYFLSKIKLWSNKDNGKIKTQLMVSFKQTNSISREKYIELSIIDGIHKIIGDFNKIDNEFIAEKLAELCNVFFNTHIYTPKIFLSAKGKDFSNGLQISESINYSISNIENEDIMRFNEELIEDAEFELNNIFSEYVMNIYKKDFTDFIRYTVTLNVPKGKENKEGYPFYFKRKNSFGGLNTDFIEEVNYIQREYTYKQVYTLKTKHNYYPKYYNYNIDEDKIVKTQDCHTKEWTNVADIIKDEFITEGFAEFLYNFCHTVNPDSQISYNSEIRESINYSVAGIEDTIDEISFDESYIKTAKEKILDFASGLCDSYKESKFLGNRYFDCQIEKDAVTFYNGEKEINLSNIIYTQNKETGIYQLVFDKDYNYTFNYNPFKDIVTPSIAIKEKPEDREYTDLSLIKYPYNYEVLEFVWYFCHFINPFSRVIVGNNLSESINYSVAGIEDTKEKKYIDDDDEEEEEEIEYNYVNIEIAKEKLLDFAGDIISNYDETILFFTIYCFYCEIEKNAVVFNVGDKKIYLSRIEYNQNDEEEWFELIFKNNSNFQLELRYYPDKDAMVYGDFWKKQEFKNLSQLFKHTPLNNKVKKDMLEYICDFCHFINPDSKVIVGKVNESIDYSVAGIENNKDDIDEETKYNYVNIEIAKDKIFDFAGDIIDSYNERIKSFSVYCFYCDIDKNAITFNYDNKKLYLSRIEYNQNDEEEWFNLIFEDYYFVYMQLEYYPIKDVMVYVNSNQGAEYKDISYLFRYSPFNKKDKKDILKYLYDFCHFINPESQITVGDDLTESIDYSVAGIKDTQEEQLFNYGDIEIAKDNILDFAGDIINSCNEYTRDNTYFYSCEIEKDVIVFYKRQVRYVLKTIKYAQAEYHDGIYQLVFKSDFVNHLFDYNPVKDVVLPYPATGAKEFKNLSLIRHPASFEKDMLEYICDFCHYINPDSQVIVGGDNLTESIDYSIEGYNEELTDEYDMNKVESAKERVLDFLGDCCDSYEEKDLKGHHFEIIFDIAFDENDKSTLSFGNDFVRVSDIRYVQTCKSKKQKESYTIHIVNCGVLMTLRYIVSEDKITPSELYMSQDFLDYLTEFCHYVNPESKIKLVRGVNESINYSVSGLANEPFEYSTEAKLIEANDMFDNLISLFPDANQITQPYIQDDEIYAFFSDNDENAPVYKIIGYDDYHFNSLSFAIKKEYTNLVLVFSSQYDTLRKVFIYQNKNDGEELRLKDDNLINHNLKDKSLCILLNQIIYTLNPDTKYTVDYMYIKGNNYLDGEKPFQKPSYKIIHFLKEYFGYLNILPNNSNDEVYTPVNTVVTMCDGIKWELTEIYYDHINLTLLFNFVSVTDNLNMSVFYEYPDQIKVNMDNQTERNGEYMFGDTNFIGKLVKLIKSVDPKTKIKLSKFLSINESVNYSVSGYDEVIEDNRYQDILNRILDSDLYETYYNLNFHTVKQIAFKFEPELFWQNGNHLKVKEFYLYQKDPSSKIYVVMPVYIENYGSYEITYDIDKDIWENINRRVDTQEYDYDITCHNVFDDIMFADYLDYLTHIINPLSHLDSLWFFKEKKEN